MAKAKTLFACTTCGEQSPRWQGKCSSCGDWNTIEEVTLHADASAGALVRPAVAVSLKEAAADPQVALPTKLSELDRVLGGGIVRGSVTLLGGEPGIGKSTLILQLCASIAKQNGKCFIVTGEESTDQVGRRAERLGANLENVMLLAASEVEVVIATLREYKPVLVIVDSVQTMVTKTSTGSAGSVSQVRDSAAAFTAFAKETNTAMVLVGHVTKDGALAGPRVLEHMVDTVLEFEGDRHHGLRFLRTVKHRFGATDEIGVLEMAADGLQSVKDASALFLDDRQDGVTGSVVVPTLQGRRPMLVEIQSLSVNGPFARRNAQGLDSNRLAMIIAILQKHCGLETEKDDVYTSVLGGLRLDDPGTDLALALSIISTKTNDPFPASVVAIGELGLSGEVRKATNTQKRLIEAQRLGFKSAIVPKATQDNVDGMKLIPVANIGEAKAKAFK